MSTLNEQTIIITATVAPLKGGKRAVIVSAAPEGELPVILSGNFAELKTLFDEAWLALLKREPVVVPDKARKGEAEKPAPHKDTAPEPDDADDANDDETETVGSFSMRTNWSGASSISAAATASGIGLPSRSTAVIWSMISSGVLVS